MSSTYGPPWTRGYSPRPRRGYTQPDLRVSDAERNEVADRLSRHYADGRLDQIEFNERLDRAMRAKTRADLGGLFTDLPVIEGTDVATRDRRRTPHLYRALFLVLLLVLAATVVRSVIHAAMPWLVVALVVLLFLRYCSWHRRR
jgi:hypothetical protein